MPYKPVISPGIVQGSPTRLVLPGGFTQSPFRTVLPGGIAQPSGAAPFVGPLDAYTADLQVAVLPFRGFTAYVGPWLSLRASGGGTADIGYLANGQPDTAAWATHVGGGTGFIPAWYDQSGGGRDMVQVTDANQLGSVLNVVNGYPVAQRTGVAQIMASTIDASTTRTLFAVVRKRSAQSGAANGYTVGINGTANVFLADNAGSPPLVGGWGWRATVAVTQLAIGGTVTDWSICVAVADSASAGTLKVNNGAATNFDPTATMASGTSLFIGQNPDSVDIDVAAVLLYNAALDDATELAIATILAAQFGITLAP